MQISPSTSSTSERFLGHWILFAAACNGVGWILSWMHALHLPALLIGVPVFWWMLAGITKMPLPRPIFGKFVTCWKHRIRHMMPLGFAVLAILALIGGILTAPNNFDALNYRMPKVAHWLMAERWEWIPAFNNNLNTRSSGFEWLSVPMIALLRTDRLLFLYNWISFLLLPGLIFSLFRRIGVSRRVSMAWMWLLPSGYCFVLQAASVGNDLPAAMFALAAFDFGMKWRIHKQWKHFCLALLACGMMTAIKPTTLPLLLPFGVLFFSMWRPLLQKPLLAAVLLLCCGLASFLPTAVLNVAHCGDWTGAAAENPSLNKVNPWYGLAGNLINAPIQNLAPPVFPLAGQWNRWIITVFSDDFLYEMEKHFELRAAKFGLTDIQGEESAGVGTGISVLWLLAVAVAWICKKHDTEQRKNLPWMVLLGGLFSISLFAYFAKTGMNTVARHIAPYYVFLLMIPLVGRGHDHIVRSTWWRIGSAIAIGSAILMVIITPSRPLWPAQWFFAKFGELPSPTIQRAKIGYEVYAARADGLGELRDALPAGSNHVGLLTFASGPELPLWKPYLQRRVRHIRPTDSMNVLKQAEGIRYVVINTLNFETYMRKSPQRWLEEHRGEIIHRKMLRMLVKENASEWWVVKLPES